MHHYYHIMLCATTGKQQPLNNYHLFVLFPFCLVHRVDHTTPTLLHITTHHNKTTQQYLMHIIITAHNHPHPHYSSTTLPPPLPLALL